MDLSNRFAIALVLNLALVAGAPGIGLGDINVSAQEPDVCALVTDDEIESLAPEEAIAKGVSGALPSFGLWPVTTPGGPASTDSNSTSRSTNHPECFQG